MLKGKTALITGTNKGIGRATLQVFAENHATVYAHARSVTEEHENFCKELENICGVRIVPIYFDVTENIQMKRAITFIRENNDRIDVLVNNLGQVRTVKNFAMTSIQELKDEFEVNFFAQMELTQYVSRMMIKNKTGSIINISACAAMDGNSGMLPYVSSKSAIIGATKRLAIEFGMYGIRVNSIAPGLTDTEMASQMKGSLEQETLGHVILGRKANPKEIANVVTFVSSDLASYMTGQIIRVDGGMLL